MAKKLNKTKYLGVRLSEEGYELLDVCADHLGLGRGPLIEMLVREKIREREKTVYIRRDETVMGEEQ